MHALLHVRGPARAAPGTCWACERCQSGREDGRLHCVCEESDTPPCLQARGRCRPSYAVVGRLDATIHTGPHFSNGKPGAEDKV